MGTYTEELLESLRDIEAEVLILRFGVFGISPMKISDLSTKFGISEYRLRQIQYTALRKCRHPSREFLVNKCESKNLKKAILGTEMLPKGRGDVKL